MYRKRRSILKFRQLRLDIKLRIVITFITVLMVTVIIAGYFIVASYNSSVQKKDNIESKLEYSADVFSIWLENIRDMTFSVLMNDVVQDTMVYMNDPKYANKTVPSFGEVHDLMSLICNMDKSVLYMALIDKDSKDFVSHGNYSMESYAFRTIARWINRSSLPAGTKTSLHYVYSDHNFRNGEYTFAFTHPVYSTTRIFESSGTLIFLCSDDSVKNVLEAASQPNSSAFLCDRTGYVIIPPEDMSQEEMRAVNSKLKFKGRESGTIIINDCTYQFQKVKDWNFYFVVHTKTSELSKVNVSAALIIVAMGTVVCLIAMWLIHSIISSGYRPMHKLMSAMERTRNSDLSYRIDSSDEGEEFMMLEEGYNSMMDTINSLLTQVREEQHQLEQIQLNALQAQIKPHFLYNTLECIHWQAKADGSNEASKLVKALASYYRMCLSKGKEIVPLSQELEHIRTYLFIQNARYGDIVEFVDDVSEEYLSVQIPKLTLQPLIENCVYHGVRVKEGRHGKVYVTAYRTSGRYIIEVADDGQGMNEEQLREMNESISDFGKDYGYGVRNVHRRIELYFGKGYGLFYRSNEMGGLTCEISIPLNFELTDRERKTGEKNV